MGVRSCASGRYIVLEVPRHSGPSRSLRRSIGRARRKAECSTSNAQCQRGRRGCPIGSWKLGVERWTFRFVRCTLTYRAAATSCGRSPARRVAAYPGWPWSGSDTAPMPRPHIWPRTGTSAPAPGSTYSTVTSTWCSTLSAVIALKWCSIITSSTLSLSRTRSSGRSKSYQ